MKETWPKSAWIALPNNKTLLVCFSEISSFFSTLDAHNLRCYPLIACGYIIK